MVVGGEYEFGDVSVNLVMNADCTGYFSESQVRFQIVDRTFTIISNERTGTVLSSGLILLTDTGLLIPSVISAPTWAGRYVFGNVGSMSCPEIHNYSITPITNSNHCLQVSIDFGLDYILKEVKSSKFSCILLYF